MSDLELSDEEINSVVSDDEPVSSKPTFTIKGGKKSDDDLKEYDDDGNIIIDYNDDEDEDEDEVEVDDLPIKNDDDDDDGDGDGDGVDDDVDENDPDSDNLLKKIKKITKGKNITPLPDTTLEIPEVFEQIESDYNSDNDEDDDDEYLQKFDKEIRENYIMNQHPESLIHNYEEIYALSQVQRNKENIIIDGFHRTIPILTKYEKAKILGLRAKQLNGGAKAFVTFKTNIIDGYLIALKELEEKKLPFIIRRPIPGGASEYWNVKDLELI